MYDIDGLERQWIRYRRKKALRHLVIAAAILFIIGTPIAYISMKPAEQVRETGKTAKAPAVAGKEKNVSKTAPAKTEKTLSPQLPSMQMEPEKRKKPKIHITLSDLPVEDGDTVGSGNKKIDMEMSDAESRSVIQEIESRFPVTKDYDDAMYLAKYYYGRKNYKKAEAWAMQANTIDSGREESWIIFGKAKAKQGHRAEALRVLQAYFDRTGSEQIKELIDRIRKGRKF